MRPGSSAIRGVALALAFLAVAAVPAFAVQAGELEETTVAGQVARFFQFRDRAVLYALAGAALLGLNCGLLGGFVVMRRMALVGDTLSHAVLPGIALGFLWHGTKDPVAILVGATAAGMLGILTARAITATSRIKRDAALGIVLGSFFAAGICLIHLIPGSAKSGINAYFFGQAAALGADDIRLMAVTTGLSLLCIGLFYKGFLLSSFDREFAGSVGFPVAMLDRLLLLLTAFSIVVAMGAVGVVLASAMLVIPAASAYLLTDNMRWMLFLAAIFGTSAAAFGAFVSFLGNRLPTGPFMVVAAAGIFALAFLCGPRHGWLARVFRTRNRRHKVERENTLKAIYRVLEDRGFEGEGASVKEIAKVRREPTDTVRHRLASLRRAGLATLDPTGEVAYFTPEGYGRACAVVRNHRLWELYLTDVAEYEADHVHDDAEIIEHVLGEDTVRRLERALSFPNRDPHGKPIPSLYDLGGHRPTPATAGGAPEGEEHGYR